MNTSTWLAQFIIQQDLKDGLKFRKNQYWRWEKNWYEITILHHFSYTPWTFTCFDISLLFKLRSFWETEKHCLTSVFCFRTIFTSGCHVSHGRRQKSVRKDASRQSGRVCEARKRRFDTGGDWLADYNSKRSLLARFHYRALPPTVLADSCQSYLTPHPKT